MLCNSTKFNQRKNIIQPSETNHSGDIVIHIAYHFHIANRDSIIIFYIFFRESAENKNSIEIFFILLLLIWLLYIKNIKRHTEIKIY